MSTIIIEASFTIRSSNDNLRITVEDESGNQIPYIKKQSGRVQENEEDEDTVMDVGRQKINVAGDYQTSDIKHQNIYVPAKANIDQQALSFRNRLLSKLGINKEMNKNSTSNSHQVRSRRELIYDCRLIMLQQTFVVEGCTRMMQVPACSGSCPNGGSGKDACRTTLSHDVPLRFNCPGVSTTLFLTMADYCSCTKP